MTSGEWTKKEAEWKVCKCPICDAKKCRLKEFEIANYKYECDSCGSFVVSYETLKLYKAKITENKELISRYLKSYLEEHDETLEIVHVRTDKKNKITVEQILDHYNK